ncbi:MAG: hypothetical protein ABFQ65_02915 [Nanoarchaeota archaeon]
MRARNPELNNLVDELNERNAQIRKYQNAVMGACDFIPVSDSKKTIEKKILEKLQ